MLYWGEGNKDINYCRITNSDLALLKLFKKFLQNFWSIQDTKIKLTIHCYTDYHNLEEIENYWLTNLSLSRESLNKSQVNKLPKSSKNLKKSEWGTASLSVYKTEIVQEIFGAIQGFANFKNNSWLN